MNSTETKASCVREVEIEIPADVVASETDSLVQKYSKVARVPGFRRGKVPATIIRSKFAAELKSDVTENLVPKYFREEVEKQGLTPISQPRIVDLHLEPGEPLRFKATFEVMPEIEVSGYKDLAPETRDITVSDEEVNTALENIRQQHATYEVVSEERDIRDGDFAQISFQGSPTGEESAEPVNVDEVLVEIGGSNTVQQFSENLRGAKPGETCSFEVPYPEDFADKRLAGKTFSYAVTVKGIKTKSVPELNDEFAKVVGEFESIDALRQRIREGMEHERRHQAEHEGKEKIIDELVKSTEFPVPDALVENAIDQRLERGLRALAAQGMRAEDLKRMDFSRLRAGQREAAIREVKASLILDKVADLENIQVSDEEMDREVEGLAAQYKQPADEIRARLTRDGALDRIRTSLRNQKTLDFLYRKSA